jgi:hypothetical protein
MGHPDPTNFHFVVKHTWLSAPSAPPRDRMQDREVIAKIKWSRSRARYGTRISKRTRQQPRRNRGKLKGGGCETRSLSAGSLVWISQFKPGTKAGVDSCKQARQAKPGEARMPGAWGLRLLLLIGVAPARLGMGSGGVSGAVRGNLVNCLRCGFRSFPDFPLTSGVQVPQSATKRSLRFPRLTLAASVVRPLPFEALAYLSESPGSRPPCMHLAQFLPLHIHLAPGFRPRAQRRRDASLAFACWGRGARQWSCRRGRSATSSQLHRLLHHAPAAAVPRADPQTAPSDGSPCSRAPRSSAPRHIP